MTGKAPSPTVDSRDVGTAKVSEDHDRNRCLDGMSLTLCSSVETLELHADHEDTGRREQRSSNRYALASATSVGRVEAVLHDRIRARREDKSCSSIQDRLESVQLATR